MLKFRHKSEIAVWAIDPFEGKLKPHRFEVRNLLAWTKATGGKIQPVYVLKLDLSNLTSTEQVEVKANKINEMEAAIGNYLQEIGCTETLAPRVLVIPDGSVESMVESLVKYSDDVAAEMIIVSSRGRKGFDRFVFGSFAETLLLKSTRPLYFLTHQLGTLMAERGNKVLFATDFSKNSESVFKVFLKQAKASNSEIILYYAITLPPSLIIAPDDFCNHEEESAKSEAQEWMKKANSEGIKVSLVLQYVGGPANVAQSIIDVAKEKAARFVAMASSSGKMESFIFGSVAREVFRANLFPVWTCGSHTIAS